MPKDNRELEQMKIDYLREHGYPVQCKPSGCALTIFLIAFTPFLVMAGWLAMVNYQPAFL